MKLSKAAAKNKIDAYLKKFNEYDEMSLNELLELEKTGKVKGTYHEALVNMIKLKQKLSDNK